jgi:ribosomal protein S18 acetylase RimI-like enzyme
VRILPADPEHAAEIARLAAIVWRVHYPGIISHEQIDYMLAKMYDLEVLRREMAEGISYLRALEGNQLLGFASYGPAEREIKLHKLYVDPSQQRRGIGSALIEHVEAANSGRTLVLTVNKRNRQAIAAYQKHGFLIRESIVVDIGGGFVMDDYVMAKGATAASASRDDRTGLGWRPDQ